MEMKFLYLIYPSKATSSPKNFLKFWEKRFNRAGDDSIRKISKLYSLL